MRILYGKKCEKLTHHAVLSVNFELIYNCSSKKNDAKLEFTQKLNVCSLVDSVLKSNLEYFKN